MNIDNGFYYFQYDCKTHDANSSFVRAASLARKHWPNTHLQWKSAAENAPWASWWVFMGGAREGRLRLWLWLAW